ncbi:tetratricopeptide repeat-containing sensor histidine kinase [Paraflavitalea pollutisoli]|uniref:tetratricopeptide repeat-containing sensor histidine kinase n=1 Tax=Paraflavitalea pollutisoli TaxID=3034143 RepID=UPI0023EBD158|nr:histidine kinase dimerization/phosphoacceptor domain -containing protein [Paraflavitalea sp. H1-2-19X]
MKAIFVCFVWSIACLCATGQRMDRGVLMKGLPADHVYQAGDTVLARQMLQLSQQCLYKPKELVADIDSARVLLQHAFKIYQALHYTAGLTAAWRQEAGIAIEAGDLVKLGTVLPHIEVRERLNMIKHLSWVYQSARKGPGVIDSSLRYAHMMQELARDHGYPDVANDAEFHLAFCAFISKDLPRCKQHFMNMVTYQRKKGDKRAELEILHIFSTYLSWADTVSPTKLYVIDQKIAAARQVGDMNHLVNALHMKGQIHIVYNQLDAAESSFLEANDRYVPTAGVQRFVIYELLSKIHMTKGNADKALYFARAALDNVLLTDTNRLMQNLYRSRLAEVVSNFGKKEQFVEIMATISDGRAPEQSTEWFYILSYATVMEARQGITKALAYLQDRYEKVPHNNLVYVAGYERLAGRLFLETGDLINAKEHLLKAVEHTKKLGDAYAGALADIYMHLAQVHIHNRAFDDAEAYLNKAANVPKALVPLYRQVLAAHMRFSIDSAQGRYASAIQHFGVHKQLSDSVFNLEKTGQMEELNVRYQTEQQKRVLEERAREILWLEDRARLNDDLLRKTALTTAQRDSLQEQYILAARADAKLQGDSLHNAQETNRLLNKDRALQDQLLEQTRHVRNLVVAGTVLLVLLLLLIYNRYRLKQRSNRQLQQQQQVIESKNHSLEKLLDEKVWLLKEVHHRVKNNLQVVMSLLNTQSYHLQDDAAISAIRDSQRRVNAISLIHKKLYQSDDPAMVDMVQYISELVIWLQDSTDDRRGIRFVLDIAPVTLGIHKALPIGLILNEAVTNAYKYAFDESGLITITLRQEADDQLLLTIADNGKGMVEQAHGTTPSLGMSLMRGLANDLDGHFHIEHRPGVMIAIRFPAAPDAVQEG